MKKTLIATAAAALLGMSAAHAGGEYNHRHMSNAASASAHSQYSMHLDRDALRNGVSAERILGMDVQGVRGESIGEVENIIVSRDGHVRAVVVDAGGILGVGETAYRIPWREVRMDRSGEHLIVPLAESDIERFRWGAEDVRLSVREMFVDSIMDSDVALNDGMDVGEIEDLIIGRDGRVKALVVESDIFDDVDRIAFPFHGPVAYNAWSDHYTLPIDRAQFRSMDVFDYEHFNIDAPAVGATGDTAGGEGGFFLNR